jgi:hypothetical protein
MRVVWSGHARSTHLRGQNGLPVYF